MEGVRGGDLISLLAYVSNKPMKDAALALAIIVGVDPYEEAHHGR
jgi:hypothetical protein